MRFTSRLTAGLALGAGLLAAPAFAEDAGRWEQLTQSNDPQAQLTYASVMFYQARRLLVTDAAAGQALFKQIEALLGETVRLTERSDAPHTDLLRSQAFFLLAETSRYVFRDFPKAIEQYEHALAAFPGHAGAAEGLGSLRMAMHGAPAEPKTAE